MEDFLLQPSARGRPAPVEALRAEAVEAARELLERLPFPVLWIGPEHDVRWRNPSASACYGASAQPCHLLIHGYRMPCDRHGEPCPLRRAVRSRRVANAAHVHEGRAGHDFFRVTALPVEGNGVLELHWPLDEVIVRDALTGAHTRRFFEQMVRHELDLMKRMAQPFSLVLLDVDRLKELNDGHGHAAGDAALRAVGRCLMACARGSDVVGRLGGDEFCLFLPATRPHSAATLARRLSSAIHAIRAPELPRGVELSVSLGIYGGSSRYDLTAALAAADHALYRAKRGGRDRIALA